MIGFALAGNSAVQPSADQRSLEDEDHSSHRRGEPCSFPPLIMSSAVCIRRPFLSDRIVAWQQVIAEGFDAVHAQKATVAAPSTEALARTSAALVQSPVAVADAVEPLQKKPADASHDVHATVRETVGDSGDPVWPKRSLHAATPQAQGATVPPTAAADAAPINVALPHAPTSAAPTATASTASTERTSPIAFLDDCIAWHFSGFGLAQQRTEQRRNRRPRGARRAASRCGLYSKGSGEPSGPTVRPSVSAPSTLRECAQYPL